MESQKENIKHIEELFNILLKSDDRILEIAAMVIKSKQDRRMYDRVLKEQIERYDLITGKKDYFDKFGAK